MEMNKPIYNFLRLYTARNLSHINCLNKRIVLNKNNNAFLHTSTIFNGEYIKMPSLSPTMTEGTIVKWLKKEGDPIQPGDVICDIQTDKAVVAFELEEEGILAKILVPEDTKDIGCGVSIAFMVEEGEDWKNVTLPPLDDPQPEGVASESIATPISTPTPTSQSQTPASKSKQIPSFGPSVKLLLEKYGLNFTDVMAGGPHGRLLKGDILREIKNKNLSPLPLKQVSPPEVEKKDVKPTAPSVHVTHGDEYDEIEVSSMRKTIAKRLTQSKSEVSHSYMTLSCCVDKVLDLRKDLKSKGVQVSVNDIIIKAVAGALVQCPQVNSVWKGQQLVQPLDVDISVAVATDNGLITPIVKNANLLGLEEISSQIRELAGRAKIGKLKLDEFQGGTFTISNLGMFGISEFSAIINPPQTAILAVGGSIPLIDCEGKLSHSLKAQMSYDRLAIDDDTAAEFMSALTDLLENPHSLLLQRQVTHKVDHPLAALL